MDLTVRPVSDDELPAYIDAEQAAFGEHRDPAELEHERKVIELDRTLAAFEGDRIVGTAGSYSYELTVPGPGQLRAAGVTAVGVLPTHRRRGILTRLMAAQLDDVAARGEPLAILTASDARIYGRFGYGPASFFRRIEVLSRQAAFVRQPAAPGRVLLLDKAEAAKVLPEVHERARLATVGAVGRTDAWWAELLRDPEQHHGGKGKRFDAIHERSPGQADGYFTYRVEDRWQDHQARHLLHVVELVADDDEVRAALWRYAFDVDLVDTVRGYLAIDDPLAWRLADLRQLRTTLVGEHLWLRVLDVPAALDGRVYGAAGRLVLGVRDGFRPDAGGTFAVTVDGPGEAAQVGRTDAAPDLELGAGELGALYLGGVSWRDLGRAGRVNERTPGGLALADRMFATYPGPWCDTDF
jgi:predicted acetyltransferase